MSLVARLPPRHSTRRLPSKPGKLIAVAVAIPAALFFVFALSVPVANAADEQTQLQLNEQACGEYKKADAEMNRVYELIRRDYRGDRLFLAALRKAQLAWIRYRDAHVESIFPGDRSQYGSINPMCRCGELAEMTKARTTILNRWVEGIEEGDVCAGSVKTK